MIFLIYYFKRSNKIKNFTPFKIFYRQLYMTNITTDLKQEMVILVDQFDNVLGTMEKMEAHQKGLLHRAFSVFVFNQKGELLLQQRALSKYHSAGLWTNTCCSHPRPGEDTIRAAERRLQEEMGLTIALQYKACFTYKAAFSNNLTEHEFDHVFIGKTELNPSINSEEVESYKWSMPEEIKKQMLINPDQYTSWFKIAMDKLF